MFYSSLRLRSAAALILVLALGCSSSSSPNNPTPPGATTFSGDFGWTCASGVNCQDVFDFTVTAGSVLNVRVSNVSDGSASQVALYGPGVALGGTNLLTGTNNELRCITAPSCSSYTAGEQKVGVTAATTGTYRLAVTRNWGISCGATGTYNVQLTSNVGFQVGTQTVQDGTSQAPGSECK